MKGPSSWSDAALGLAAIAAWAAGTGALLLAAEARLVDRDLATGSSAIAATLIVILAACRLVQRSGPSEGPR